jgi:hypothetical protein
VFENKVLRKIFWPKEMKQLRLSILSLILWRTIWVRNIACMGKQETYKHFVSETSEYESNGGNNGKIISEI